jgi:hypothetical protein
MYSVGMTARRLEGMAMLSPEEQSLVRRAKEIYNDRLKASLEKTHRDAFVAIEPDSGDYFLGSTLGEAAAAAERAHPDRRTYVMRVGHRAAIHMGAAL